MRILSAILLLILFNSPVVLSEDQKWENFLSFSVKLNNYSSAMSADGFNEKIPRATTNIGILLYGEFLREEEWFNWKNVLKLEYSLARYRSGASDTGWIEDADQLLLDSIFRRKIYAFLQPYVALNIDTSVYDTGIVNEWQAFRPVQLRESIGLSLPWKYEKIIDLSARLGLFYQHYINSPDKTGEFDKPFSGQELIVDLNAVTAREMRYISKLGLYAHEAIVIEVDGSSEVQRVVGLEWTNTVAVPLTRLLNLAYTYNLYNINILDRDANFEWAQWLNLVLSFSLL